MSSKNHKAVWTPAWPGMRELPPDYKVRDVSVIRMPFVRARGFWPFKWIEVGERFFTLDAREQQAVLLHELGHCRGMHMEIRLLLMPFCGTRWARSIAHKHELAADAFVRRNDYGHDMVRYLRRFLNAPDGEFHPSVLLRIDALER